MDQKATTQNYVSDEPFRDARDVVDRLLPFHIWQMHDEDLDVREKSRDRKVAGMSRFSRCVYTQLILLSFQNANRSCKWQQKR